MLRLGEASHPLRLFFLSVSVDCPPQPADLFPAWKWIDLMEQSGEIKPGEARLWKEGIYGLMVLWRLEPDEVLGPSP